MNIGLILVPIIAGYWYFIRSNRTKYTAKRLSGYDLFFHSAVYGFVFFLAGSLLFLLCSSLSSSLIPSILHILQQSTKDFEIEITASSLTISGVFLVTLALAHVLPILGNLVFDEILYAKKAAYQNNDYVEWLLQDCMENDVFSEISTRSSKFYIGLALRSGITSTEDSDIMLIPFWSGYRDKDTRELVITTSYSSVLRKAFQNEFKNVNYGDFRICLPMSEIVSVRKFDFDVFDYFQMKHAESQTSRVSE